MENIPEKAFAGPGKYIQGRGALAQLGRYTAELGEYPLLLADSIAWPILKERVQKGLESLPRGYRLEEFGGQSTALEVERVAELVKNEGCDCLIALGGGKTIDTGKAAGHEAGVPLVIAPTIASNDAPCSRLSIIYSQEGVLEKVVLLKRNPEMVLVDTQVIASAPVRFLVAGMGDAIATKFETEQCYASNSLNVHRGLQSQASLALSDLCYRLIRENGVKAKNSVECRVVGEALERVVEANILLSGIGFESGGLAIAHALTRGFSSIPDTHASLHGEEVAFGVLVQMVVENRSNEFLADLMGFYRQIGLPCTLAGLGIKNISPELLAQIAGPSATEGSHIYKMSVPMDEAVLQDALLLTDQLGRAFTQ